MRVVTGPRYCHFDRIRRICGHPMPPSRRQPAGCRMGTERPHSRAHACSIGERSIVGEIHASRTTQPAPRPDSTVHGILAQTRLLGLGQGNHAVMVTQVVVKHMRLDGVSLSNGSHPSDLRAFAGGKRRQTHTNHSRSLEISRGGAGACPPSAVRGRPDRGWPADPRAATPRPDRRTPRSACSAAGWPGPAVPAAVRRPPSMPG